MIILSLISSNACAQWYLFPGRNKEKKVQTDTVGVHIETPTENVKYVIPDVVEEEKEDEYNYEDIGTIRAAVILPLQASGKASANFLEMYGGILMAVRDMGEQGTRISLNVYDSAEEGTINDFDIYDSNDIILGPVTYNDIVQAAGLCPKDRRIISPLEPKAAALVDSSRVIQMPVHWTRQIDEVTEWISSGLTRFEKIVVFEDSEQGEQKDYILSRLESCGKPFTKVAEATSESLPEGESYRCIIASDREEFIFQTVKNLSSLANDNRQIVLYSTSRVKSNSIDAKYLHTLNTHMTAVYFTDTENSDVRNFTLKYRALFKTEPGSFAFQGYDTMHYFIRMCTLYGKQWYKKIPEYSERGLQADFRFESSDTEGSINTAIRRVVFGNSSTSLLQ